MKVIHFCVWLIVSAIVINLYVEGAAGVFSKSKDWGTIVNAALGFANGWLIGRPLLA